MLNFTFVESRNQEVGVWALNRFGDSFIGTQTSPKIPRPCDEMKLLSQHQALNHNGIDSFDDTPSCYLVTLSPNSVHIVAESC